jgi:CubicO group peptidase (beta-lactamase class C family)
VKKLLLFFVLIAGFLVSCSQPYLDQTSDPSLTTQVDELITGYTEEYLFSGSVLIAEKGLIVLNKGYVFADYKQEIPNTPHTQFSIGSVTKLFTCAAIRMEADRGYLSPDDTLVKYIPDYPRGDEITISQLLNHRSGIVDLFNDLSYNFGNDPFTIEELIDRFKYEPLEFDPGAQYEYSNSGYILLAYIIEQSSGFSYYEYIEKKLFTPLEMNDSIGNWDEGFSNKALGYYSPGGSNSPPKYPDMHHSQLIGTGNLFSTVEDLYLWYQVLHGDEDWSPYDCGSHFGRGYGYHAAFVHNPDTAIIVLSNYFDAPLNQMVFDIQEILLEDDLIELDTSLLDSFVGEYFALTPDGIETIIRISREGNHLVVSDIGSNIFSPGDFSLFPISSERFIIKYETEYGPQINLQIDETNKNIQIIIDEIHVIKLTLLE